MWNGFSKRPRVITKMLKQHALITPYAIQKKRLPQRLVTVFCCETDANTFQTDFGNAQHFVVNNGATTHSIRFVSPERTCAATADCWLRQTHCPCLWEAGTNPILKVSIYWACAPLLNGNLLLSVALATISKIASCLIMLCWPVPSMTKRRCTFVYRHRCCEPHVQRFRNKSRCWLR